MSVGKKVRLTIQLELLQVGPDACTTGAIGTAVAKVILGRLPHGKTVWAVRTGDAETAYTIRSVRFGDGLAHLMEAGQQAVVFKPDVAAVNAARSGGVVVPDAAA